MMTCPDGMHYNCCAFCCSLCVVFAFSCWFSNFPLIGMTPLYLSLKLLLFIVRVSLSVSLSVFSSPLLVPLFCLLSSCLICASLASCSSIVHLLLCLFSSVLAVSVDTLLPSLEPVVLPLAFLFVFFLPHIT